MEARIKIPLILFTVFTGIGIIIFLAQSIDIQQASGSTSDVAMTDSIGFWLYWIVVIGIVWAVAGPSDFFDRTQLIKLVLVSLFIIPLAVTLYFGGIGKWTGRTYENVVERCIGNDDCDDRSDFIRTITNGTLRVKPGRPETVYIVGTVRVPVPTCHSVNATNVKMTWDDDVKNVFLNPLTGTKQKTTVTVKRSNEGTCATYKS